MARVGQFADKHKMMIGYHGHAETGPAHWEAAFARAKYNGANLDIGHFIGGQKTSPIPFLKKHHDRITHIHVKDKTLNDANVAFGQGDTPIKEALRVIRDNKWKIQATIEFEYPMSRRAPTAWPRWRSACSTARTPCSRDASPVGPRVIGRMRIQIDKDRRAMSEAAASMLPPAFARPIERTGKARVVAATGASQLDFLNALTATADIAVAARRAVSSGRVHRHVGGPSRQLQPIPPGTADRQDRHHDSSICSTAKGTPTRSAGPSAGRWRANRWT